METMDERKQGLRRQLRRARFSVPAVDRARADETIAGLLLGLSEYQRAEVVLPYLSFGSEVETRGIIRQAWADGKVVALPRCVPGTREMRWYRVDDLDDLVRSPFGVEEPRPEAARELSPDASQSPLALVPGLSFDAAGYRLGYGGGYYDRFLASFSGVSVGLCREALLSAPGTLPVDAYDLPVQLVVTEGRVIRRAIRS